MMDERDAVLMSEPKLSWAKRVGIICVFASIGPLVGTLIAMWQWIIASLFLLFPLFALFGYVFGLLPAILAGLIYSLLPFRWPRILLAPFVGATATLTLLYAWRMWHDTAPRSPYFEGVMEWALAGAVAALACAVACRLWKLDAPEATKRRERSATSPRTPSGVS